MGMSSDTLLVGVDGGGTGCRVAIADPAGHRIGEASSGSANYTTNPWEALENIVDALDAAALQAGLSGVWQKRCVAHLGLAGVMDSADAQAVAAGMPFERVGVTDDRATSLAGALADHDGILAAIGTGTIVAARSGSATRYFGGWGHNLSDEASGGWLGHMVLRRAILAHDGLCGHSDLTASLLRRFDNNPNEIVRFAKQAGPGDYAAFAPMVVKAAKDGDSIGLALMKEGAAYLNLCISVAGLGDDDILCLSGGVGPHYSPYLDNKYQGRIRPPCGTALDGALFLAARQLSSKDEAS